jgi:hypothetical protein
VLHSYRLALVLAALALTGALAFTAAASQAAIPPPLAAKESAATAPGASSSSAGNSGDVTDAGKHLGDLISAWSAALLLPVAGFMGFAAFGRGGVGAAIVVAVITLIVGGFVFAPEEVIAFIKSIWHTVRQA